MNAATPRTVDRVAEAVLIGLVVVGEFNWNVVTYQQAAVKWAARLTVWGVAFFGYALRSISLPGLLAQRRLWPLSAFLAWTLAGALWSVESPATALLLAGGLLVTWLFVLWFVTIYGWQRFQVVAGVACVVFLLANAAFLLTSHDVAGRGARLAGLTYGPTALGRFGALSLVLAISLASRTSSHRPLGFGLAVLGVAAIAASQSFTAVIAVGVASGFMVIRRAGRSGALVIALVGLATAGAVALVNLGGASEVVSRRNSSDIISLTGRTAIWRVGLNLAAERPFAGWGTASGNAVFGEATRSGEISWLSYTAHNVVLQILVTLGMIGVVLFVLVGASYVRDATRRPVMSRDALILTLLVSGTTEPLLDLPSLGLVICAAAIAGAATDLGGLTGQAKNRYRASPAALVTSSGTSSRVRRPVRVPSQAASVDAAG